MTEFRLRLSSGSIELLKWLAAMLMTLDHINRLLLNNSVPSLYALGRIAMPLFAFVLAYNLAQSQSYVSGIHLRVIKRLAFFALISMIPFSALNNLLQGWLPLNILFMLLFGTVIIAVLESNIKAKLALAIFLFILAGAVIEYWWAGLGLFIFFWRCVRTITWVNILGVVVFLLLLGNVNNNEWAFAVLPIIYAATQIKFEIPRVKHFFYLFYPLHLSIIWALKTSFST